MRDVIKGNSNSGNRRRKRRGNYKLHYSMVALVAVVAFTVLSVTVFFNIDSVVITGSSIYTPDEIIAAGGIKSGDNLVRKNLSGCERAITSELIYIENAKLKRHFPSSLKIEIEPCVPTAVMENNGGYFLISKSGKILEYSENPYEELLTFYGTEPIDGLLIGKNFESADSKKTSNIYELIEQVQNSLVAGKISKFDVSDRLNVSCIYDNRIKIELGAVTEIDYKLKFAYTIITQKIGVETEGTLKMLSGSATFIDKNGLEQNEKTYLDNIGDLLTQDNVTTNETSAQTTSVIVNFE